MSSGDADERSVRGKRANGSGSERCRTPNSESGRERMSLEELGNRVLLGPKCLDLDEEVGRGERIRTSDLLVPNQAL